MCEYRVQRPKHKGDERRWKMLGPKDFVEAQSGNNPRAILDALRHHDKPMTWTELKEAADIGSNFDMTLKRLVTREIIEKNTDGKYIKADLRDILGGELQPDLLG